MHSLIWVTGKFRLERVSESLVQPSQSRARLASSSRKVMDQLVLETISEDMKDKKVVGSIQRGFMKGKSCSASLMAFCTDVTRLADKEKAADIVCLNFSKAFGAVCHNFLIKKLTKDGLGKWTVRWIGNCWNGRALGLVVSGTRSSWS